MVGKNQAKKRKLSEEWDDWEESDVDWSNMEDELFAEDSDEHTQSPKKEVPEKENGPIPSSRIELDKLTVSKPFNPSEKGATSKWKTGGSMKRIAFTKENKFLGRPQGVTPVDYFNFFFSEDFLTKICDETNMQAVRCFLSPNIRETSRITHWRDITVPELRIYIGLVIHMGTIRLNRLFDYWKTNRLFKLPIFSDQMPRNRFAIITKCMHFNPETASKNPFDKVRIYIDYFNSKMTSCYYPSRELTLDNSTVMFNSRLRTLEYIKYRPNRFCIQLCTLSEPNGPILKFSMYIGNNNQRSNKNHSEKVVMELLDERLQNGHVIYLDQRYNSCELAKKLLDYNTYCTGTLRRDDHDNPSDVINQRLKPGENVSRFHDGVHVGKWNAPHPILYLSTAVDDRMVSVRSARGNLIKKPEAIVNYEDLMPNLSRHDQIMEFYPCEKMKLRWNIKIGFHIYHMLLLNSWYMYNKYSGQAKLPFYEYRMAVISALLPDGGRPEKLKRGPMTVRMAHKICRATEKLRSGRTKRRLCRHCQAKQLKKPKHSVWYCANCPGEPALCVECFDDYHIEIYKTKYC